MQAGQAVGAGLFALLGRARSGQRIGRPPVGAGQRLEIDRFDSAGSGVDRVVEDGGDRCHPLVVGLDGEAHRLDRLVGGDGVERGRGVCEACFAGACFEGILGVGQRPPG